MLSNNLTADSPNDKINIFNEFVCPSFDGFFVFFFLFFCGNLKQKFLNNPWKKEENLSLKNLLREVWKRTKNWYTSVRWSISENFVSHSQLRLCRWWWWGEKICCFYFVNFLLLWDEINNKFLSFSRTHVIIYLCAIMTRFRCHHKVQR